MRNTQSAKHLALLAALLFGALAAAPAAAQEWKTAPTMASPVTLNETVEVESRLIRLGDLFTISGEKAAIEIAYAPEPGKRAVFDARWLYRVAHAYQLPWRPLSEHVRTVVSRKSEVIDQREIKEVILDALIAKGAEPNTEVELSNRLLQIHVPADGLGALRVEDAVFDKRSQRFTAILAAPSGKGGLNRMRVRGRLFKTAEVPVLGRRILAGEIITAKDIQWTKLRASRLQANTIMSETDLIGHTPRRGLRAGYPVQASAVQRPVLVAKGSLVTMVLKTPQMLLTAQGKSLENGADGDVIRIRNAQSKTVIEAEVIGEARVAVRPSTLTAMN